MGMMWQKPAAAAAQLVAVLLLVALALALSADIETAVAAAAADTSHCEALITTLVPCLAYVQGQSPLPSHQCCANVLPIHQQEPQCLCELIVAASQHNPQLPTLNLTLSLSLGPACNIATKPSRCPALLGFAPGSPEANLFPSAAETPPPPAPTTSNAPPSPPHMYSPPSSSSSSSPWLGQSSPTPLGSSAPPSPLSLKCCSATRISVFAAAMALVLSLLRSF